MVDRDRFAIAEHAVGKGLALADRDRGQLHAVGHVAHGIDVIDIGLAEAVDLDLAALAQFDAGILEAQPFGVGNAPDGEQHQIGLFLVAIGHLHEIAAFRTRLDVFERRVEAELDPLHRRDLQQPVAHRLVIAAQQPVAAIDDVNFAAELVEDAGEFIGDIAAARDDDLLGQFVEMERLVRADRMFGALAFGHARARAGGDQDGFRGHDLAARQRDFVRAGDLGALLEDRHLVAFERVGIGALDPLDVVQHIVSQRDPVEGRVLGRPAEIARVLQVFGEMRAVDEHLLGHAAADDTGPADAVFLGHGDLGAMRRRHAAGAHAARASADGEEVEIILAAGACRQNLSPL